MGIGHWSLTILRIDLAVGNGLETCANGCRDLQFPAAEPAVSDPIYTTEAHGSSRYFARAP